MLTLKAPQPTTSDLRFFKLRLKFETVKENRFIEVNSAKLAQFATFPKLRDLVEMSIENDQLKEEDADYITSFEEIDEEEYLKNV
jgi:hypothetical protein